MKKVFDVEKWVALDAAGQLRSERGYKRPSCCVGKPTTTAPNRLHREFAVAQPDQVWVTDITYIRTYEGWLYLILELDLHLRRVVDWAMGSSMATELELDELMMAVRRRRPQGACDDPFRLEKSIGNRRLNRWCKYNRLVHTMSRPGNFSDNAVVESFVSGLKMERIERRIYPTRDDARSDVFEYIEGFCDRVHRHSHLNQLSPTDFEQLRTGS